MLSFLYLFAPSCISMCLFTGLSADDAPKKHDLFERIMIYGVFAALNNFLVLTIATLLRKTGIWDFLTLLELPESGAAGKYLLFALIVSTLTGIMARALSSRMHAKITTQTVQESPAAQTGAVHEEDH